MKDQLKVLCESLNIKIVYGNKKPVIISSSIDNDIPIIYVHTVFRNCPEKISHAIINYHMDSKDRERQLKIIEEYAKIYISSKYIINPPNKLFTKIFTHMDTPKNQRKEDISHKDFHKKSKEFYPKKDKIEKEISSPLELEISHITEKDFYGNNKKTTSKNTIKATDSDILNLDIVVNDFN